MELKLCYCANNIMYFTSDMASQWGDDWDDRPYEHNADPPYEDDKIIKKIKFKGCFMVPCSFGLNSTYSVQDINNHVIPWAFTDKAGGLYGGDSMDKAIRWLTDNNFDWEYVK